VSATLGITKPTALPGYVEMPESAGTVHVTKLAAAQRQLRAAIRLYFANEDELAIYTVASAAYRLISDLKAARGMNEAADSHLVSIFYVVRSFRRGTLPRHISENAEMMRWVMEMAEQMPITADSTPDEVTVSIGAEAERAFWRSRNEASNFLKHADKDAQAHIGLDKINNLSLLMQTMVAYTDLVKNDLGAEGLVLWLFASVSHGETETLPERFQVTAQKLLAIDDDRRREFCHALVCELRAKAASDA